MTAWVVGRDRLVWAAEVALALAFAPVSLSHLAWGTARARGPTVTVVLLSATAATGLHQLLRLVRRSTARPSAASAGPPR